MIALLGPWRQRPHEARTRKATLALAPPMVKKALCVGCNYASKLYRLSGPVNDAFLIADCLQRNCEFDAENVCVLYDIPPGQKRGVCAEAWLATRANILQ